MQQFRNRLLELKNYQLPTDSEGYFLKTIDMGSANNCLQSQSPLKFLQRKRTNFKQLEQLFSNFVITNRFPKNLFLFHPRTILVCNDVCEEQTPSGSCTYKLTSHCFTNVISCYDEPFDSAKYHVYIGDNVSPHLQTHDVTTLLCKMYLYKLRRDALTLNKRWLTRRG